ncbi:3-oxoacyl-[acyl-carrier-protein] synthase III [Alkalithermobacter thermoalcaliphilus JW-YL-7 = DSM 7308]|uniref:Beta-ketoacyl-[acyl-carrier-protein] synthase III n=1 Tax=Alkalithermobacter thermoalcaliphilus JW-YL-7 = DSM 7308 TaxID=1121328 RepID=A0A150FPS7_CLOPD|nr:3-oxoacyl-(acyl-carrier-protein) synthase 3 [[Clostridium] paradoxum JW-YL-7 = DSM 7308]SHK95409.1 3-oxoacyl-[acyl-carrier-protein] synthase III [[Clostridium] paradoxum JW-YL-7 = DSM 7308]
MKIPKRAGILGIGSFVPEKVVTNFDMEKIVDTSDEWIFTRTGIKERRIAGENVATSDLATNAAKIALENASTKPEEIDLIIVATVTPDMTFPSTACIVQKNIGATRAAAFDLEAACSGFIYSLSIANQFIQSGTYKKILVIGAETLSKIVDWTDRNTCVLFGDGAGAVVLGEVDENEGILSTYLGADGSGGQFLTQPAGGSRLPASFDTVNNKLHFIKMEGNEVFKFAVRIMGESAKKAIELAGLTSEDIDFIVPHQANIRIIEASAKRLKVSMDKVYVNLDKYGNMSSASIPVALDEAYKAKAIKRGDNIVLVGFGGGLTWGSVLLKWSI